MFYKPFLSVPTFLEAKEHETDTTQLFAPKHIELNSNLTQFACIVVKPSHLLDHTDTKCEETAAPYIIVTNLIFFVLGLG